MIHQIRLWLILILSVGSFFRLINLGEKPLWLDEMITGLFTFGQGYQVIPRETVFSLATIPDLFTYQERSCSEIATFLAQQSTHPPLFFCLIHRWLRLIHNWDPFNNGLAFSLRFLPAIFGIITIVLLYYLNRQAFSEKSGVAGAAVMAISPFAVYLSQEARQYTFLLILITLALLALVRLIQPSRYRWLNWLLWGVVNSLGAYTHYFFLLSFSAQILILFVFFIARKRQQLVLLFGVTGGVILTYLPWFPTLFEHFSSPKTDWLGSFDWFTPIYQITLGWIVMMVTFPVENQPILVQILSASVMLGFSGWFAYQVSLGYRKLLQNKATREVTIALSLYIIIILVQFLFIIYGLGKNIAIAPRYNYVYYPAICSLFGASLMARKEQLTFYAFRTLLGIIGAFGVASCLFVLWNLFFLKPYFPGVTAERLNQSSEPMLIVMGYQNDIDLALGLSYGLALHRIRDASLTSQFIFLDRRGGYERIWKKISELRLDASQVWVVGTGLKEAAFPEQLNVDSSRMCQRDRANYYRIGIPYQRYQCEE